MSKHRFNRQAPTPTAAPDAAPAPLAPPTSAPRSLPPPQPPTPDACAVVRYCGQGAFGGRPEHTIGDTPIRSPLMRTACVSVPARDIGDALQKGFEFVRWARGSVQG